MPHKSCLLRALFLCLLSIGATLCLYGKQADASSASRAVRLPILGTTAISTLDPIQSVELAQYDLCNQIFEGLVTVDANGTLAPGLATRWEHSPDYRVWKFYLRDATFADDKAFPSGKGRTVTADDVLYSFKRGLSPQQGSRGSFALSRAVVGAREYSEGTTQDVPGLRILEPDTIEIELTAGDRFFPAALTVPATYVVPKEAVELYGIDFGRNPVGSGPFTLGQWNEGINLTLVRNEAYGKGTGEQPAASHIGVFEFRFFRSEAAMVAAFRNGELDARPIVGVDFAVSARELWEDRLAAQFPNARIVSPGWVLKLHLLAPQMGEGHAFGGEDGVPRQALTHILSERLAAIDAFRGVGKAQQQLLPDNLVEQPRNLPPSLDNLEQTLRDAVAGRTIRVAYASSRVNDIVATMLERTLTDAGARVRNFPSTSINALFGSLATVQPDLTLIYWSPYYPNVSEFLTALLTASQPVPNFTGFSSLDLDALHAELVSGQKDSATVTTEIDALLNVVMPWMPLYMETPLYLVSKELQDFTINPVSVTQLTKIRFTQ